MSLLEGFFKRKPPESPVETEIDLERLTSFPKEMDIRTLDQSLDHIAKQSATIQGLSDEIKSLTAEKESLNADLATCIDTFGLTRINTEDGGHKWQSSKLDKVLSALKELTAAGEQLEGKLSKAEVQIAELLAEQKSVAARALEFLASQGGKPLPLSGTGKPAPSGKAQIMEAMDEARKAGDQEAVKRYFEQYQKLKKS